MGEVKKRSGAPAHAIWRFADGALVCLNCGDEYKVNMPIEVRLMAALAREYGKNHRRCRPRKNDGEGKR